MGLVRLLACLALASCAPSAFEPGRSTRADVLLEWGEPVLSFAHDTELVYCTAIASDHSAVFTAGHYYTGTPGSLRRLRAVHLPQHRYLAPRVFVFDANGILVENR